MFQIAIIDDEPIARKRLLNIVNKTLVLHKIEYRIDQYGGPKEFLKAGKDYQLIFLDIEMKDENGVELSKHLYKLKKEAVIVFVTSYEGYIRDAFGLNIYSYVMKEEVEEKIPEILLRILDEQDQKAYIIVNTELGPLTYKYQDVLYFMIDQRKCYVYTKTQSIRVYETTLKGLKNKLNNKFLQPNAKYLIHGKHIESIENGVITLSNSECIFISRGKVKKFMEEYKEYLIREAL